MNDYLVQLINAKTGQRSPTFVGTLPEIVETLSNLEFLEGVADEVPTMVLILAMWDGDTMQVVNDHLMYVHNFVNVYRDRETHFEELDTVTPEEQQA